MHLTGYNVNTYYTGSKAEGLDLTGSDIDYMYDMNNEHDMQVMQTEHDTPEANHRYMFVMSTEYIRPCFAMLRSVSPIRDKLLLNACQEIDSSLYLSNYLYVHNAQKIINKSTPHIATTIQGPSVEGWGLYEDRSQSGTDSVFSIHCSFWPDAASEWRIRSRRFPWPSQCDVKTIVNFGFHLVPIGHPHSDTNMMEWRMSFSVAERTLVWSFGHIQMQCYAVMKLILKEYINPHCSPPCRVLCSYFIKTFLFWEYEGTDPCYWCKENLRKCVMRLLSEFCGCVRMRSLRHYFIPSFNLLSVKMTDEAQNELLRIFDIILQSDISILKECKTLNKVWIQCLHRDTDTINVNGIVKKNVLRNDLYIMKVIAKLQFQVLTHHSNYDCVDLITLASQFINHFSMPRTVHKTHLMLFAMRILLTNLSIFLTYIPLQSVGNKTLYMPCRLLKSNVSGIDISVIYIDI